MKSWSARRCKGKRAQVVIATKFGFDLTAPDRLDAVNSRPEHVLKIGGRMFAAARHRLHRFVLSASRRSVGAHRRHGRRDGAAGEAGQGALSRPVRSRRQQNIRRAHAVHPISALQSEYSLVGTQPRSGHHSVAERAAVSVSCPSARSAADSSPARRHDRRRPRMTISVAAIRAFKARTSIAICSWSRK